MSEKETIHPSPSGRGAGGEGFKPTELGDLPAEWEVVRLGDFVDKKIVQVKNGFPFGGFNEEGRGIPHLRPFNINNNASIDLSSIKYVETNRDLEAYLLQPGDVFFNNTNSEELVGKTTFWDKTGQYVYSNHMTSIRVSDQRKLDPYFLMSYFYKRWGEGYFQSLCRRHVNQASISLARMKQIPIPLPPLDEQRRIAHVLNTVQQAIAAQDDLIAAAQEVKRSLMRRLFSYGPGSEPAPTKETEIGEVPAHWEVVELGEVADIIYGIQAAVAHMTDPSVGIPILTNINMTLDGKLDFSVLRYYELSEKQKDKRLQKGDVLFNWRSGSPHHVGKTAIFDMDGDYTFSSFILRFRVNEKVNNLFLAYYLHWLKDQSFFVQNRQQSSVNSVFNASAAAEIPTIVPPLDEQRQIAHILQTAAAKIAAEQDRRAALQALFDSLLQALMTGKLRV